MSADTEISRLKVLIVDDHMTIRRMLGQIMYELGVKEFQTAENGKDALEVLEDFRPDIVILDHVMEPIDGTMLTRIIRAGGAPCHNQVPIIMISGHTSRELIEGARDAGINEFLAKPLSIQTITSRIKSVLAAPRDFVDAQDYYGPDRRRRNMKYPKLDRRKSSEDVSRLPTF